MTAPRRPPLRETGCFQIAVNQHQGRGHPGQFALCEDPECRQAFAECAAAAQVGDRRVRGGLWDPPLSTGRPPR